jgi:hypothetical protein
MWDSLPACQSRTQTQANDRLEAYPTFELSLVGHLCVQDATFETFAIENTRHVDSPNLFTTREQRASDFANSLWPDRDARW